MCQLIHICIMKINARWISQLRKKLIYVQLQTFTHNLQAIFQKNTLPHIRNSFFFFFFYPLVVSMHLQYRRISRRSRYTLNHPLTYCDKKDGSVQTAISRLREIYLDQDCCYSSLCSLSTAALPGRRRLTRCDLRDDHSGECDPHRMNYHD